jgi:hypothetical protein
MSKTAKKAIRKSRLSVTMTLAVGISLGNPSEANIARTIIFLGIG